MKRFFGTYLGVAKQLTLLSALTLSISVGYSAGAYAAGETCSDIFRDQFTVSAPKLASTEQSDLQSAPKGLKDIYENKNKILSERYPQLAFAFKNPEAFVAEMRLRFERQKEITPEDPRLFEFPEAAETIHLVAKDLESFRQELVLDLRKEKKSLSNRLSHKVLGTRSENVENLTKALAYVSKVQADVDGMISSGSYPYLKTIYATYFYARIRGYFQFSQLTPYYKATKWIDMHMHGYRKKSLNEEIEMYKASDSPLVQVRSSRVAKEFRLAEVPFKNAFERKDVLEYVIIPSVFPLGSSAFMHILPHNIHIIGATNSPVEADGFNRPGGLFWMHDVRHEADRYMKITAYSKAQQLTENQNSILKLYMHKWHNEVIALKNSIQDPAVKTAVEHYHFYTHHDVGVPLTPSMFLNHYKDGLSVYYAFLFHKKNADQGPGFDQWIKNTKEAQRILSKFWSERLAVETELLGHAPVKIENWEDYLSK